MYTPSSVFKDRSNLSPGAPRGKSPNISIIFTDDIATEPVRNAGGVVLEGNFTFKEGKGPIKCYMTASKQAPTVSGEGEEDSISLLHKFEGMHPGDSLEIEELIQNLIGQNVILIYGSCNSATKKVFGTTCAPLQLKPSFTDNNESLGYSLVFEQFQKTNRLPGRFNGALPTGNFTTVVGNVVTASQANGNVYQLASFDATTALEVENEDLESGTFVTLVGDGGSDPATLSNGAPVGDGETILLKNGAQWTALDGATIDLELFNDGSTSYFIERKRT